ncbi:MAG: AtpZ/AtpI family protein [Campylobacteraceae bacterium]|jgi:F0F1-type ATP synthase assembly protein I|nr:AtpZ/AtpI family protein [Campylobacteraceae bacterium]
MSEEKEDLTQESTPPQKKKPKYGKVIAGANELSLGISIVVAIVLGVLLGLWLKSLTGYVWTLWIGVFFGIGAAVKNVHIAYKKQKKSYDELKNEPRYRYQTDDEDDDDKY